MIGRCTKCNGTGQLDTEIVKGQLVYVLFGSSKFVARVESKKIFGTIEITNVVSGSRYWIDFDRIIGFVEELTQQRESKTENG